MSCHHSIIAAIAALTLTLAGCSSDDDNTSDNEVPAALSNAEKAVAVLASIESGDSTDFNAYVSSDTYIQHNLGFPDGASAVAGALDSGAFAGTTVDTARSFNDGDIAFLHTVYGGTWNGGTPQVAFDVFRFEDGLIVEHWDNLANVEEDNDGTTQTDGTLAVSDSTLTESTRTLITSASNDLFLEGQWSRFGDFFDLENYVQHSVGAGPDSAGIVSIISGLPEGTPFYSSVEYIYADGDFALMLSEGFPNADTGLSDAYYDLFRVNDGKIVEHWDVIQTIPDQADWANQNGKW